MCFLQFGAEVVAFLDKNYQAAQTATVKISGGAGD
jgi:hypothetical protein